jgi:hypothetical protein
MSGVGAVIPAAAAVSNAGVAANDEAGAPFFPGFRSLSIAADGVHFDRFAK